MRWCFGSSRVVGCLAGAAFLVTTACHPAKEPQRPTGDPAMQRVAKMAGYCRQGAKLWRASCTEQVVHGLCVARGARLRGGSLPAPKDLRPRRADPVKAALKAYAAAWALWDGGRAMSNVVVTHPRRTEMAIRMRECAAEAAFVQVEPGFVSYLREAPPADLDFNPADPQRSKASLRAFREFLKHRLMTGVALMKRYMKVITDVRVILKPDGKLRGSPVWALASIARSAQVFHDLAHTLSALPTPAFLTTPEAQAAYREQMAQFTRPLLKKAHARYQVCLQVQHKLKVPATLHWVTLCREGLASIPTPTPDDAPVAPKTNPPAPRSPARPTPPR